MALIRCPDCGREVSDAAPACPHCGRPLAAPHAPQPAPQPRKLGCFPIGCLAVLALAAIGYLAGQSGSAPSAASTPARGAAPELPINYREVGAQGLAHFVVVPKGSGRNRAAYQSAISHICGGSQQHCEIIFFDDASRAAHHFPMSDREVNAWLGTYTLNPPTGFDSLEFTDAAK